MSFRHMIALAFFGLVMLFVEVEGVALRRRAPPPNVFFIYLIDGPGLDATRSTVQTTFMVSNSIASLNPSCKIRFYGQSLPSEKIITAAPSKTTTHGAQTAYDFVVPLPEIQSVSTKKGRQLKGFCKVICQDKEVAPSKLWGSGEYEFAL
ncbi:hypothetical protein HK102_013490 [Quaeritorhiza haematococci]|nr:hypothetical protein HK102_013490 [Quaeritorhiza haematococci]